MTTTNDPEGVRVMPHRDWFTIGEVANEVGKSYHRVYRWICAGQVRADLAGKGTYLVHRSEIDAMRANGDQPLLDRRDALRRHNRNTQPSTSVGESSNRPSVRKPLDPNKIYRIRSTGERVTGAELLRRREQKA